MKKLILLLFIPFILACDNNNQNNSGIELTIQISGEDSIKDKDAIQILNKRLYSLLNTYPKIEKIDNNGRYILNISKKKDKFKFRGNDNTESRSIGWSEFEIKRIKDLIETRAQLEFWDTFKGEEFLLFMFQANEIIKSKTSIEKIDQTELSEVEELLGSENDDVAIEKNPILDLIKGQGYQGGPIIAQFDAKAVNLISKYLSDPDVKSLLQPSQKYVKFLWGIPEISEERDEIVALYALKGNRENLPQLSGSVITDARQSYSVDGVTPTVSMRMNTKGAKIWEEMTGNAFNQGSQIAIVLDDIVYSAPGVTSGPISGGYSEISGAFDLNEAIDLANVLRSGAIPKSIKIIDVKGGYEAVEISPLEINTN